MLVCFCKHSMVVDTLVSPRLENGVGSTKEFAVDMNILGRLGAARGKVTHPHAKLTKYLPSSLPHKGGCSLEVNVPQGTTRRKSGTSLKDVLSFRLGKTLQIKKKKNFF